MQSGIDNISLILSHGKLRRDRHWLLHAIHLYLFHHDADRCWLPDDLCCQHPNRAMDEVSDHHRHGVGCGFQQSIIAAQALLRMADIPSGTSAVCSSSFLVARSWSQRGKISLPTALPGGLATIRGVNAQLVIATGVTKLNTFITNSAAYDAALEVYSSALTGTYWVSLIVACLAVMAAVGMEWKSVKTGNAKPPGDGSGA